MKPEPLTPEEMDKFRSNREDREKNASNVKSIRPPLDPNKKEPFTDPAINNFKRESGVNVVTNPIQNFDGPDADLLPALFGGRFAPNDPNADVGPNHVVVTVNSMVQVFDKSGTPLTAAVRISNLLGGIANATDDDGDPIVLYDWLADRWFISQFNVRFNASNQMHMHVAVSKTADPTGEYFAYDFLTNAGRFVDYPHVGVWHDGYYMASNDFTPPGVAPFIGAGAYVFERAKMLAGDPTAKIIGFNLPNTEGGMLPTNQQGYTPPPPGTPNLFIEFDADEFGGTDAIRIFEFRPNFANPANSTLTQLPDIPVAAFDARNPAGRADIAQPAPGEGLDGIADRLMHALNFRVLPGGVQSFVFNWTVNVSGVNPTSSALFQAGVRWMEIRRNPMTGAITINQQATYAPGAGSGTGRDLWMAAVAQDGEGNIGLAANAAGTSPALNPTAIYTGRLAGDPLNTLPQGEVDALSMVVRGVQTSTSNRWGDYSSLFVDPADDCTFWGTFEYADAPTATFDWNTRIFSFKVNPMCQTSARGTFSGTITNCITGQPIENAVITSDNGLFRQTNASGNYSILAAPGTYNVSVTAPGGFNTVSGMVTVTDGGNATFNACLTPSAIIESAGATIITESCSPANGAIDPGETVTVSLCLQNVGAADTVDLVGTLQATGGVTNPSGPQSYGAVVAGGAVVCRNFTFTASGTCGGTITATLDLVDTGGGMRPSGSLVSLT
ncbi:MAG TPA: carboxypeptidase-like regulatory domain-containing protein, partial [Blastocatellia bacterium]|nr:carboxypeptidase-like regulatory domain-containing protein [Blastocatellia bacterium]